MAVEIRPVVTRRELRAFIRLPWRIYRNEPKWVAPLVADVKKRLDQGKNPFFKHAQAQYFLAYRDGQPVGRVSAHIDQNLSRQHQRHEIHGALEIPDMRKPGVERHDQEKGKEHLYARDDHAQLAGHRLEVAIQTLKVRLPAPGATGVTLAIGVGWLSVRGHHQSLPAVTRGGGCS